jgi:hypothetical protein
MNASSCPNLHPHTRSPIKRGTGFFTKRLTTSQHDDAEKTTSQVLDSSSPEKDGNDIGAFMPNEKIENAPSIANAVHQQRHKKTLTPTSTMQNALQERLEAKLLANEVKCTKLRKLIEAGKRGIPLSLAALHLGFELEKESCFGESCLLKKLEALVLEKENECTKVRRLLVEARKRGAPQIERGAARTVSLPAHREEHQSYLRKQPSSRKLPRKTVSWRVD